MCGLRTLSKVSENTLATVLPALTSSCSLMHFRFRSGVYHMDLKADNIVNNRLIDLDNYFFQASGHRDWCMSGLVLFLVSVFMISFPIHDLLLCAD